MNPEEYNDALTHDDACPNLWRTVLLTAIEDALYGPAAANSTRVTIGDITAARRYLTIPNRDFNDVCIRAGLDPEAVREHLIPIIANARTPEEIIANGKTHKAKRQPVKHRMAA